MTWETLGEWWLGEVQDPAYEQVVTPLLLEVLVGIDGGGLVADLGCGDGRVMGRVEEVFGATVVGVELVEDLARRSGRPVVVGRLPDIPLADGSVDGAYAVLVLEHLDDHESFFAEAARVVRRGGFLAIVSNHPYWTAPGSTPISDTDGEILWRPGDYFDGEYSIEAAGDEEVVFYHRSISELLNAAAEEGWALERMVEQRPGDSELAAEVPRLIGIRWLRT